MEYPSFFHHRCPRYPTWSCHQMPLARMVLGPSGAQSGFAARVFFSLRICPLPSYCSSSTPLGSCVVLPPCAILVRQYGSSQCSQLRYFQIARRDAFAVLTYLCSKPAAIVLSFWPLIHPAERITLLTFCLDCAYRSSAAWLLTSIRSPIKFRHHCSCSWYLLLDPPVFWSLGSGLGPIHSSCLCCWAAGLLSIMLQFFPAVLSVIRMAADVICDLVGPDPEVSSIFGVVLYRRCPFLAH